MKYTANYELNKPEAHDYVRPDSFNDNADAIDFKLKELEGAKLDEGGDGKDVTVTFDQAASRENVASGEKLSALLGKVRKWFSDLGSAAFQAAEDFASAAHKSTHAVGGSDALAPVDIGAAVTLSGTATLALANWAGSAPYTYTIAATGVLATDRPHLGCVLSHTDRAADKLIQEAWGKAVSAGAKSANGQIILYADEKPAVAIPMQWEVTR